MPSPRCCDARGTGFFGIPALDVLVPEGLGAGLHMVETGGLSGDAAASGLVVSFVIHLCSDSMQALWVCQDFVQRESGRLYGPGLADLAMSPASLIIARARRPRDVLWAMEEGLQSGAVRAVVGEMRNAAAHLDLTATRRLSLQSEKAGIPVFLVVDGNEPQGATAAKTRWRVSSRPTHVAGNARDALDRPAWSVDLIKNKKGPCGRSDIAYHPGHRGFVQIDARHEAVRHSAAAPDREGAVIHFSFRSRRGGRSS